MVDIPYHTHSFDIPIASEGEIRTGVEAGKAITPDKLFPVLADKADKATTLAGYGITDAATKDQGQKADTAVQPPQVSAVGFSGRYNDLLNKPALGGSSSLNVGTTTGTVAAGDDARIVNAVQKATTVSAGTGLTGGGTLAANISLALSSTSLASLALADSSVQPSRKFTVGTGLSGGGDFSADRFISLNSASIASLALADSAVQPARILTVGTGLTGGGDLSANRSIALSTATIASLVLADNAVPNVRTVTAGAGLAGGGALSADILLNLSATSQASLAKADTAVQPAGIAGFATKAELTAGLATKLDSGAQAADSAKLQGYTAAELPISTATQTALSGKATTAQGSKADSAVQPSDLGALATKDKIVTADIDAAGSTANGALLTRGGVWVDPTGGGDMFRAVYDPNNKAANAFDMANMTEAANAKVMTAAERTAISDNSTARHAHGNKTVLDATTASYLTAEKTKLAGIAAGATANTGTVTNVGVAVPTGLSATGAITTSGTITISYAAGYQGYTTAEANKLAGIPADADKTPALAAVATTGSYVDLSNIPATFPPSAYSHTPAEVGLGNVNNTSDANKPVSTAQQAALNGKLGTGAKAADSALLNGQTAVQLPVSSATQTALAEKAGIYTGSNADETNFPVGTIIGIYMNLESRLRNKAVVPRLYNDGQADAYSVGGTGSVVSGTWRLCGTSGAIGSARWCAAQRIY